MAKTSRQERQLMRLVHGELSPEEAQRLESLLAEDPALAARYERLLASWEALAEAAVPSVPEGFRDEVVTAARRLAEGELSWSTAPVWARAGVAAALAAGLTLGLFAGRLPATDQTVELDAYLAAELESAPLSLAEAYWLELEEGSESLAGDETP